MKRFIFASLLVSFALVGCTDAKLQQLNSLGSKHKVTLYAAGGQVIHQWTATGNVSNEQQSDGWYFKDEETGKLVEITGTIVIEQQ